MAANTVQTYLNIITSEYQNQPNFISMISQIAEFFIQQQNTSNSMIPIFDLGTPPVGNQLDIIGEWAGISRNVNVPIAGVYFTWDDVQADGWDYGTWQQVPPTENLIALPDDVYLTLILAKIAANQWDGTTEGAYAIWGALFPNFQILIQDYNNMSFSLGIVGGIVDSVTLAIITGGYIPLRPEGVQIVSYFVPPGPGPLFAWDTESTYLAGWDSGSWAIELAPTPS
jgi:hypothetical protein